ncbi:TIGR03085 family metal-binding protein [Raineyella sp. LH-20]|uniref:TIGR03085 family metal-binding protein n=1 Tax=Raineyella sp. LH-20 TaxID=3081204 RepID=UPI002953CF39|nr:TIGR03085 family metal-binding protein [Raineyella sp. LH-20]WOP19273.1 TIGR03085 family metal-binding protein [Raineyella sp. LH-20]
MRGPPMDRSSLAQRERHALCDQFLEVDPHLPTLCEGWVAYDLVAHLWVRDTDPLAGLGIAVPALGRLHDARIARARRRHTYADLVARVRKGPPTPLRWADRMINTLEYLIHHEDLRRGETYDVPERELTAADDAEIMSGLVGLARLQLRSRRVRTVLVDDRTGRQVVAGSGPELVTVTGRPIELALYAFGRARAAHVRIDRGTAA